MNQTPERERRPQGGQPRCVTSAVRVAGRRCGILVQLGADDDGDATSVGRAHSRLFRFDHWKLLGRVAVLVARQFSGVGLIARQDTSPKGACIGLWRAKQINYNII